MKVRLHPGAVWTSDTGRRGDMVVASCPNHEDRRQAECWPIADRRPCVSIDQLINWLSCSFPVEEIATGTVRAHPL